MNIPRKLFTILSGPNGAGKTTFVENIFPSLLQNNKFINADHVARDLNPHNVTNVAIRAEKQFLKEVDTLLEGPDNFIIETTLSGKSLLKKIKIAQEKGFHVKLIFLWITSRALCDFRVKGRVASGGHSIPWTDIKRRYLRGLTNLEIYRHSVDSCEIYSADHHPKLILTETQADSCIQDVDAFNRLVHSIKTASCELKKEKQLI